MQQPALLEIVEFVFPIGIVCVDIPEVQLVKPVERVAKESNPLYSSL
jgi:hypothetical protein